MVNLDYLYNPDAAKKILSENHFVEKNLSFRVIENGMILPRKTRNDDGTLISVVGRGGIIDSNGQFIKSSFVNYVTGGAYTPPKNQFYIALKPSFISWFLATFGVIAYLIIFAACGFSIAMSSKINLKIVH